MKATRRCSTIYMMCKGLLPILSDEGLVCQVFSRRGRVGLWDVDRYVNAERTFRGLPPTQVHEILRIIDRLVCCGILVELDQDGRAIYRGSVSGGLYAGKIGKVVGQANSNQRTYPIGLWFRVSTIYEMNPLHRLSAAL